MKQCSVQTHNNSALLTFLIISLGDFLFFFFACPEHYFAFKDTCTRHSSQVHFKYNKDSWKMKFIDTELPYQTDIQSKVKIN